MDGITAAERGKAPRFILMTGRDLYQVLSGVIALDHLLREKFRRLAEMGDCFLGVDDVIK